MYNDPVKLAFVDTETTGLDDRIHSLWEIAIIQAEHRPNEKVLHIESEGVWRFEVDLSWADPMALKITNYFKRQKELVPISSKEEAHNIARRFDGRHFVGAVPDFDNRMIRKFLWENGETPTWHYHLICVENLLAGRFSVPAPWKSDELSKYYASIEPPGPEEKHTALGDAVWAMKLYASVYNLTIKEPDFEADPDS